MSGRKRECQMVFHGLQKLTLLDYPGKVACTLFTAGCNLRCPFCHNATLARGKGEEVFEEETVLKYLDKRKGVLDGVCVTGGEPLLMEGLYAFLKRVRERGLSIKLDTNGTFPAKLKTLVRDGLIDYVAMDVKSSPTRYAQACGRADADCASVRESIAFLLTNAVDYEFRTTVVQGLHDEQTLTEAAQSIRGAKRYYLQKFVDSGDLMESGYSAAPDERMREYLEAVKPYVAFAALRGM